MDSTVVLSESATSAMRVAAARRPPDRPLSTGRVFAILSQLDHHANWSRLWLETGEPDHLGLADAPDGAVSDQTWEGVPLTTGLARALSVLDDIREAYHIRTVSTGLLAVALVADRGSGAARRLTSNGLAHPALLDLVQSEILGTTLNGLGAVLAGRASRPPARQFVRRDVSQPAAPAGEPPVPPVDPVEPVTGFRPGLRRLGWIAVSLLAVLGIVVALRTSPSFHSAVAAAPEPPFTQPALAARLVTDADVRSALGVDTIEVADRPPDTKLWQSDSPLAADMRTTAITGGWQREFSSADQARYVQVRAVEVSAPEYFPGLRGSCSPATDTPLPAVASVRTSGFLVDQDGQAKFCALTESGRLSIAITAGMRGDSARTVTMSAVQRLATRQAVLMAGYVPVPAAVHRTHYARDSINRRLFLAAILAPLIFVLPLTLIDRATWRRLRRRLRRRANRDPFVLPVDPAARLALSEATALALIKVAVYVWVLRLSETLLIGTYWTAAMLLGAFGVISVTESRLLHRSRGRYTPRPFTGARRLLAVGGLTLTAGIAALAFLVAEMGLALAALGFNPVGPDYLISKADDVGIVVALVILAFAIIPLMLVRRLAMRRIRQEAQSSSGRHIIMLRSFADDKRRLRARRVDRASIVDRLCLRRWERFEEVIASALSTVGPVIALSHPKERLPPALGAVRQQFPNETWREDIQPLIRESALVCVVVGRTQSLLDELQQIRILGALPRTLFLIPPCNRREQRRRIALVARELGIPWERMVAATRGRDALLVLPHADPQRAVIFTGRAPDDVSYESAVHAAVLLLQQPPAVVSAVVHTLVADFRQRTANVHPQRPAATVPLPAVQVYAPGKAPNYVPFYRNWKILPWMISMTVPAIGLIAGVFVTGIDTHKYPGVPTGTGTATSMAEDDVTGGLYAAIDGRQIAALDPAGKKIRVVGTSTEYLDDLIVHGPAAFGDTPIDGKVSAVSLTTHRPLWTVLVAPGVKGLALAGDVLVTTVPARHQVVALSVRTGEQVAVRTVEGTPWGVTTSGDQLIVPIVDRGRLAYLDPRGLAVTRTVATVTGPQRVLGQGSMLWVLSPTEDRVVRRPAGPGPARDQAQLLLSDPAAMASAGGGWFAVQGHERVTLVSAAGLMTRVPLPYSDVSSMCVTRSGHLFVGVGGKVAQLH